MTPTNTMQRNIEELKRALIVHLEINDELPTLDKLTKLTKGVEMTTGEPLTLSNIVQAVQDAVKNHADAQTSNALEILYKALNGYGQTGVNDTGAAWRQLQRMQTALDTLKTMETLRL